MVISNNAWNKLSPEQQTLLTQAAKDSEVFQQKLWDDEVIRSKVESEKLGATFINVDKKPFRDALAPIYDDFAKDPNLSQIMEAIKAEDK